MPNMLENLGLEFFNEDENTMMGLLGYLVENGKAITGYYGYPTFHNIMGDIDMYVRTEKDTSGKLGVCGLDTHCVGNCVWEMKNTGIDITCKDASPTERTFVFKRASDDGGMIPVHIINADVLPSFLEGDIVKMQMTAMPLDIRYYQDEDAYAAAQPANEKGERWMVANGALIPLNLLNNHSIKNKDNSDYSSDDIVHFTATVKQLYNGRFALGDREDVTFLRCLVDTEFGEIIVVHSFDQIIEEDRDNLKVGSIISGTCILSGDVAIYQYDKGIVRDYDHNLRLVRQVVLKGEAERLRQVLTENVVYRSFSSETFWTGPDETISRLDEVCIAVKDKVFAQPATITSVDAEELDYGIGTRCLILSYNEKDKYDSILFLNVNSEGFIEQIIVTNDSRYHFRIDA